MHQYSRGPHDKQSLTCALFSGQVCILCAGRRRSDLWGVSLEEPQQQGRRLKNVFGAVAPVGERGVCRRPHRHDEDDGDVSTPHTRSSRPLSGPRRGSSLRRSRHQLHQNGKAQSKQCAKSYRGRHRRRLPLPTAGLGGAYSRVIDGLSLHGASLGSGHRQWCAQKCANIQPPVDADSSPKPRVRVSPFLQDATS